MAKEKKVKKESIVSKLFKKIVEDLSKSKMSKNESNIEYGPGFNIKTIQSGTVANVIDTPYRYSNPVETASVVYRQQPVRYENLYSGDISRGLYNSSGQLRQPFDWYPNRRSTVLFDDVRIAGDPKRSVSRSYLNTEVKPERRSREYLEDNVRVVGDHRRRSRSRNHIDYENNDVRLDTPTLYNTYYNSKFLKQNSYFERLKRNRKRKDEFCDVYEYYVYEDSTDCDCCEDDRPRRRVRRRYYQKRYSLE